VNYCNPSMAFSSLETTLSYKSNEEQRRMYKEQFYRNGGISKADNTSLKTYSWETALPSWDPYYKEYFDESLSDIKKIVDLCHRNGIKLIVFTNPIHRLTYQKSVENGYLDFLYRLSDITGYFNFSGLNDITINNNNYNETSHYKMEIGDMIIDTIFNNKTNGKLLSQGFGYYVTNNNKDIFIKILKDQQILHGDIKYAF
jgi:hypothetical protein